MSKKLIHGLFDDDDILMNGVKTIRQKGFEIDEIYTPFPIHGLDKAMGLKPTRIAYASFIYGAIGLSFAIWMTWYMMIFDWPQNIGGKPSFTWGENMPSFVPIMFELTVFFAAHLMVITYFFKNKLFPGRKGGSPDPRTTDDKFLMEFMVEGDSTELETTLKEAGAIEVNVKEIKKDKGKKLWFKVPAASLILLLGFTSCSSSDEVQREPETIFMPNMYYSIAYEPYSEDPNGVNNMEARIPVEGTVKRGYVPYGIPDTNEGYQYALENLKSPITATEKTDKQGEDLYNIYCISCHGISGDGQGKLVQNEKFLGVPSYAPSRLPNITEGSIFHVMTYGKNMMGSHASQLTSEERWKVTGHVLKLRSQLK
ncbi:MAG: quinol:electron acceptor oxidoreductase subunit ActD [Bacteroidota bacterium]